MRSEMILPRNGMETPMPPVEREGVTPGPLVRVEDAASEVGIPCATCLNEYRIAILHSVGPVAQLVRAADS